MGIAKLDGLERLEQLRLLSLAGNRLTKVKKLKCLAQLLFLDLSNNALTKLEDLPDSLTELNVSRNSLTSLSFCANLQVGCGT